MPSYRILKKKPPIQIFFILLTGLLSFCTTPSILVTQEQQKGDASFNAYDYESAVEHYSAMLEASAKLGIYRNLTMEADVYRKIANCHEMLGQYQKALESVKSASRLDSIENNYLDLIEDIRQEGMIRLYMGNYTRGIRTLEKSLELNEGMDESLKNTNRLSIADTYLALGRAQSALGRFDESLDNLLKSINLYKLARSNAGEMESLLEMGKVYTDLGDLDRAWSHIEDSRLLAASIEMSTARHEQSLAILESARGLYENAIRHQDNALKQAEEYNIAGQKIWFTIIMGDIYREIGDLERAERYYREAERMKDTILMESSSMDASISLREGRLAEALDYFTGEGSLVGAGISALRMGEIYLLQQRYDTAMYYYSSAGKWFSEAGNNMGMARSKLHMGQIFIDLERLPEAERSLDSAELVGDFPENLWQIWFHRGRLHEKAGRPGEARDAYEESIRIIEGIRGNLTIDEFKSIYLDNKREVYERLINLLQQMGESADAFSYSERAKARTFLDLLANKKIDYRKAGNNELILAEQEKRFEIRNMYRMLQGRNYEGSSAEGGRQVDTRYLFNELRSSQEEYREILLQIKLNHPDYSHMVNIEPVDLANTRRTLKENTAMLAYWISEEGVHSWLISRDKFKHHLAEIEQKELNDLIETTRRSIASYSGTAQNPGLNELYRYLVKPFKPELTGYTDLVILPNGPLHFIPFQVLVNDEMEYLMEGFNISYAPSTSIYQLCMEREKKTGNRFLGMALGDLDLGDFSGLPGTEDELNSIQKEFGDDHAVFVAERSTETFIKKQAHEYRYIHFATHGSYNFFQPLYSFLLFNPSEEDDGRLTVHEVFELSLNSNLVTLSACETGLGNLSQGDELEGLSRAFIYAGSSSVIVSLWSVADYQTSILMSAFYSHLKDHPADRALALAQRDLLKRYPQPFYWAPFILIGNSTLSLD